MAIGTLNTSQITQDFAKKSFAAMITRLMPNGSAPLFGLTALLKEDTAYAFEHGFFTKTMIFPKLVLNAAALIGDTTLTVVSTTDILPGMVMRVDTTGENLIINTVPSATTVTVTRGVGSVAAAAIANSVNLWMVGTAFEESSTRPGAMNILPVRIVNYTQIFRNTWALSNTTRATMTIAGDTNVAESRQDCAAFHAADIEKALFWGQKFLGTRNGQPLHLMDGLVQTVTAQSAGNVTTLGGTTNYTQLEAALDPAFSQVTDPKVPNERILFVGGIAKRVIHTICRLNSTYYIADGQTSWGLQFDSLKIPRGTFRIVEHPLLNSNTTWSKMAIGVDLSTFNVAYMQGRKTSSMEFNTDGKIASDNGIDAVGGTLTTEITCTIKNPPANVILNNFTAGAQG